MRILFLVSDFNLTGGKERYDKNFIQALKDAGAETRVVMLKGLSLFRKIWFTLWVIFFGSVRRWDFVFCAHVSFAPICLFLKRIRNLKYVCIVHGKEVWDIKNERQKNALRHANFILSVSDHTKEKLIIQLPEIAERVCVVPNSVDGSFFKIEEKPETLLRKYNISNTKIILTVSRLYPSTSEKGYYRVIDALPLVKKKVPHVKYVIVGSGLRGFGDAREEIRMYARKKGVEKDVIFPGKISDEELVGYYNLCDVFVMPSKREGFGIVFLEALACGRPVIVGNIDASPETILNGELGLMVNPDSARDIAQAVVRVLQEDIPERILDREYLRKRVLEIYGIGVFKKRVAELVKLLTTN